MGDLVKSVCQGATESAPRRRRPAETPRMQAGACALVFRGHNVAHSTSENTKPYVRDAPGESRRDSARREDAALLPQEPSRPRVLPAELRSQTKDIKIFVRNGQTNLKPKSEIQI